MSNRFFIGILVLIAVVFGGVLLHDRKTNPNNSSNTSSSQNASQHTKGSNKTGVTLIEYGDLQCPACWRYEPLVKQLVDQYKDQITFQFRSFPLTQLHPNAFVAHRAVEAADKQGKFWEMHDLLFEHAHQQDAQGNIVDIEWTATTNPEPFFESYAKQLGLNIDQFKQDMASQAVNDRINADIKEGQKLGITGTPTFILDGVKIDSPGTVEDFAKIIDAEIKKKATS